MTDILPNEEVAAFLEVLKASEPATLLFAQGIGLYRADEIKRGLSTGALQLHESGRGLAMTTEMGVAHGKRCLVPTPALINWELWISGKALHDPPVKAAALAATMLKIRRLDLGLPPKKVVEEPVTAGLRWD